ncbi:MAG: hypothetical protein ACOC2H_05225, partial [Spirochaetota bacterium]
MNQKQHGALAAVLICCTFVPAGYTILQHGTIMHFAGYIIAVLLSLYMIIRAYCAKCFKQNGYCIHLNIGRLSR